MSGPADFTGWYVQPTPDGGYREVEAVDAIITIGNGPKIWVSNIKIHAVKQDPKMSGFNRTLILTDAQYMKLCVLLVTRFPELDSASGDFEEYLTVFKQMRTGEANTLIDEWRKEPHRKYAADEMYRELDRLCGTNEGHTWFLNKTTSLPQINFTNITNIS